MSAGINNKLPYGNLPRLLLAWVCTEAVRTQHRELILGRSLADFMRSVGVYDDGGAVRRRLRNQMQRLFRSHVELVYEDAHGSRFVNSAIADSGEFWWDVKHPDQPALWESKIELGEKFFHEVITNPIPLNMNTLRAPQAVVARPRPVPVAHLPDVCTQAPAASHVAASLPAIRCGPGQGEPCAHCGRLPYGLFARVEKNQRRLA